MNFDFLQRIGTPKGGVLGLLNRPWAIQPEILLEICEIYRAHVAGRPIDLAAVEKRIGKPLDNRPKPYRVEEGGVAVLLIEGVLSKRMNMFSEISGGTSTQLMARDFRAALEDDDVKSILLVIDSPGGEVDGTQEFAKLVAEARAVKTVVALAEDTMASAAYWIGSAAQSVYLSSGTTQVGSIGVIATHVDRSAADKAAGLKYTEITAGKYKGLGSPHQPLSKEDRSEIQDEVDQIYSIFVNDIAANRDTTVERVLSDMADGRIFIGQEAIDAGLVDGLLTRTQILEMMSNRGADEKPVARRIARKAATLPPAAPPADPEKNSLDPRASLESGTSDTENTKENAMEEANSAAATKLEAEKKALEEEKAKLLARLNTERARNVALAESVVDELITEQMVQRARLDIIKSGELRTFLLAAFARDCEADAKPIKVVAPDGKTTETSFFDLTKKVLLAFPGKLTAHDQTETAIGEDAETGRDLPPNVARFDFSSYKNVGKSAFHDRVLAHMAEEEKAGRKISYTQASEAVSRADRKKA